MTSCHVVNQANTFFSITLNTERTSLAYLIEMNTTGIEPVI